MKAGHGHYDVFVPDGSGGWAYLLSYDGRFHDARAIALRVLAERREDVQLRRGDNVIHEYCMPEPPADLDAPGGGR